MSALVSVRIGAVAAGLSGLLLGVALAEPQSPTGGQVKTSQYRGNEESSATQRSRGETTRSQSTSQTGRPHTANFRGTPGTAAELDHYLAQCMVASNQSQVEIGELAQQQAQNPQVKQFALQMIQDHRQLIEQVQRVAGLQGSSTRSSTAASTTADQAAPNTSSASRSPETSTADQSTSRDSALSRSTPSVATAEGDTANLAGSAGSSGLQRFAHIGHQINTRMTQMVKDELQQKSGAEFDKCYIGNAIGAHMYALAALEVIGQQDQGQLAQVAQQAQPKVQQHLEQAKQIMKQLEGEAGSTTGSQNQAERPTSRTQR